MSHKPRVLVGLSGGVDSAVSAALLLQEGYEVLGGFMKNWGGMAGWWDGGMGCGWQGEREDALRVAAALGIPFHTFDFEDEYRRRVYADMINEYRAGRTPNPDVLCNKRIKFDLFLRAAENLDCDFIATGHYARLRRDENNVVHLLAGVDVNKDQSYFLCQLTQDQLERALFPVGGMSKPEVRALARELGLPVANKKDSQGLCFVGKVDMRDFLAERIPRHVGNIVTPEGKVLGTHDGFEFFTIGQRGGLRLGGGTPLYVVERRPLTNEVVVAPAGHPALYASALLASSVTETIPGNLSRHIGQVLQARIRYRQPLGECVIDAQHPPFSPLREEGSACSGSHSALHLSEGEVEGVFNRLFVRFSTPQRAVAPGQFVAFYKGEELLGSAIIDAPVR